ncbi:MAG: efflux RND transporter periplasmic adaptor subunit [Syntrophobacterales bacterium]|nr:efflux RND transporter periplasmic adaptor subunit [Syntrophobacterales bacterium]
MPPETTAAQVTGKVPWRRRIPLVVAAVLLVGGSLWWWQRHSLPPEAALRLTGHIEATETHLGFKVPGLISAIHFQEGEEIRAGQLVAELDDRDLRQELAAAEARLAAAQANLARLEAGYRPQEVREAQAAVAQARADYDDKAREFRRFQTLFARRVVSAQTRDRAEAAFLMAQEALNRAKERYDLLRSGFRKEEIEQARAEAQQAEAQRDLARTRWGYARITAPVTGVVLARPAEPGQVAQVGATILTLGDLDNLWFEGWLPETQLGKVRYGQKAQVTTDSYPGKVYPGWISYIASKAEFTPKMVETFKERVTLVYRTKIRVDNPHHELKPGMPAEAVILPE